MCDYSLNAVASRPAKVGDKLTTSNFDATITKGLACAGEPGVAICLLPGTELAFDEPVQYVDNSSGIVFGQKKQSEHKVARFRQINKETALRHHDAIELPDGIQVLLQDLALGQMATVLQLPAAPKNEAEEKEQERLAVVA